MISMFIDDELDFDEKIEFVETVHADVTVKEEILSLLKQEKKIRSNVTEPTSEPLATTTESTASAKFNLRCSISRISRFQIVMFIQSLFFLFVTAKVPRPTAIIIAARDATVIPITPRP